MADPIRNIKKYSSEDKQSVSPTDLVHSQTLAYDITELKRLVGESTAGLYDIIASFIEKTPSEVDSLSEAVESQDWSRMGGSDYNG